MLGDFELGKVNTYFNDLWYRLDYCKFLKCGISARMYYEAQIESVIKIMDMFGYKLQNNVSKCGCEYYFVKTSCIE